MKNQFVRLLSRFTIHDIKKMVSKFTICFTACYIVVLLIAYSLELYMAFHADIHEQLGLLILFVPVFSFLAPYFLRARSNILAQFPTVLILQNVEGVGTIALPINWSQENCIDGFLVKDEQGQVRLVGQVLHIPLQSLPSVVPSLGWTPIKPLTTTVPTGDKIVKTRFSQGKQIHRGYSACTPSEMQPQLLLYALNAHKEDIPLLEQIIYSYTPQHEVQ